MVIGLLTLEIFLPDSRSLKNKRSQLRPLMERLRRNWNVSVTEVENRDAWQRASVAIASINTESAGAHHTLEKIVRHVEEERSLNLLDYSIQML